MQTSIWPETCNLYLPWDVPVGSSAEKMIYGQRENSWEGDTAEYEEQQET